MSNYAIVDGGVVVNVIIWDGDTKIWTPPVGATAEPLAAGAAVDIGYTFDGKNYAAPTAG